jgi:hypothetical protein
VRPFRFLAGCALHRLALAVAPQFPNTGSAITPGKASFTPLPTITIVLSAASRWGRAHIRRKARYPDSGRDAVHQSL